MSVIDRVVEDHERVQMKLAKIEAKSKVKVAKAESENYNIRMAITRVAMCVVVVVALVAACSHEVYKTVPEVNLERTKTLGEARLACIEKGHKWEADDECHPNGKK